MDTATLRILGEYERTMDVVPGTDDGWFILFDTENTEDEGEFVYDSNSITLFRDGHEVDYRLYQIDW
jgi:hypothetical protein